MYPHLKTVDQLRMGDVIDYAGNEVEIFWTYDRWGFMLVEVYTYPIGINTTYEIDKIELLTVKGNTYDRQSNYYKSRGGFRYRDEYEIFNRS